MIPKFPGFTRRNMGDFILLAVTLVEVRLLLSAPTPLEAVDWIYVLQHSLVLGIALFRQGPKAMDRSLLSNVAVIISYNYAYLQEFDLKWGADELEGKWSYGEVVSHAWGSYLVIAAVFLSFASLVVLGKSFGVRPALRTLVTRGPYRLVRHPIYLSYLISDIGYNIEAWSMDTLIFVLVGWASLIYRIYAEERMLRQDPHWQDYAASVRYRVIPGIW